MIKTKMRHTPKNIDTFPIFYLLLRESLVFFSERKRGHRLEETLVVHKTFSDFPRQITLDEEAVC